MDGARMASTTTVGVGGAVLSGEEPDMDGACL
jgi:hypothetical protein